MESRQQLLWHTAAPSLLARAQIASMALPVSTTAPVKGVFQKRSTCQLMQRPSWVKIVASLNMDKVHSPVHRSQWSVPVMARAIHGSNVVTSLGMEHLYLHALESIEGYVPCYSASTELSASVDTE